MLAAGGTDLLSRRITATPIAFTPMKLPEYETTALGPVPEGTARKGSGLQHLPAHDWATAPPTGFVLDVGYLDDLQTVRFFAREVTEGRTFRWTRTRSRSSRRPASTGDERELELVAARRRPAGQRAARDARGVFQRRSLLGRIEVAFGFQTYRLAHSGRPRARGRAESGDPAQLRLVSSVWSPSDFGGGTDTRELGVMIDRVEIH